MSRAATLLFIVAALVAGYRFFFWERDISKYADLLENQYAVDSLNYIYYGESSNFGHADDDWDSRRISEILGDTLNRRVGHVDRGAQHAEVYYHLMRHLPKEPKTVIVTLNMRSFSAGWIHSQLENSIQQSLVLMQETPPAWNRLKLIFKGYDNKNSDQRWEQVHEAWESEQFTLPSGRPISSISEWDALVGNGGFLDSLGNWDMDKINYGTQLIKNYAFLIDTLNNPRIRDFDRIVRLAEKRNYRLVFHLLPENVQRAQRLLGDDIMYFFEYNEKLLTQRYRDRGVVVVNNLRIVPDHIFIDRDFPTEHYSIEGRKACAAQLADAIRSSEL